MIHSVNGHKYITIIYDAEKNIYIDGMGRVIYDIFSYITPNQLFLFRKNKDMSLINGVDNSFKVCLIYVHNEEER